MDSYKYLIVGGGMAADAAVKGIRENDKTGSVGIISSDNVPPYSRPPLSKALWKDENEEKIWKKTDEQNAVIMLETTVEKIEPASHTVLDNKGSSYKYEKLLLATGGSPVRMNGTDGIIYYRNYSDYKKLREFVNSKNKFLVVGGGFIGSEIAAALNMNGKNVTMVFPGKAIADNIFSEDIADYITDYYKDKGVQILTGDKTKNVHKKDSTFLVETENGRSLEFDTVIAGIGIKPNTQLAEKSGLNTDNGIIVDEYLKTSDKDIFAAGDNTNFYNPALDKRLRVEHEDNALSMGRQAGLNMSGSNQPYHHLPFFYSDMFDLGYEAVGELSSKLSTYADWKEPYKEGVIYYLDNDIVKGVLLWNVWGQVDNARNLVSEKKKYKPEELKGKLPVK